MFTLTYTTSNSSHFCELFGFCFEDFIICQEIENIIEFRFMTEQ